MGLFRRRKQAVDVSRDRPADRADLDHLENFVRTRRGVEAYIEPRTTVTETTVILIADDGEWTRRRVERPGGGPAVRPPAGASRSTTCRLMGYPQRMRDYNERRKRRRRAVLTRASAGPAGVPSALQAARPDGVSRRRRRRRPACTRVRTGTPVPPLGE